MKQLSKGDKVVVKRSGHPYDGREGVLGNRRGNWKPGIRYWTVILKGGLGGVPIPATWIRRSKNV